MTYDKVKLLKQDNKQLGRKAVRLVQLNLRFCLLLVLLLITVTLIAHLNWALARQPKHLTLHQYVQNFFNDPYSRPMKSTKPEYDYDNYYVDESDLVWSEDTVELFQDQLGIINDDENKSMSCRLGEDFIVSALPGVDDENVADNVWQYFSVMALEAAEVGGSKKRTLKAFVTEQMRFVLDQLFHGLPLTTLSSLPTTCYDLKFARIIGNKSPINLREIAPPTAPLLLDPKTKRVKEIAQMFGSKMRPFLRLNLDVMKEVEQEFLVTKTIQEVEAEKEMDVNYVGVYITNDDKNERAIFMIICDVETFLFCQESFDGQTAPGDVRILRKSDDKFDFALMASCNSTIVSNDNGVLHALVNGGATTVYKPEETAEPEYNIPWTISEQMPNFYAID